MEFVLAVSKECRRRLCCDVCGLRHPTLLHIFPKEKGTTDATEKKSKTTVDDVLVSRWEDLTLQEPKCGYF